MTIQKNTEYDESNFEIIRPYFAQCAADEILISIIGGEHILNEIRCLNADTERLTRVEKKFVWELDPEFRESISRKYAAMVWTRSADRDHHPTSFRMMMRGSSVTGFRERTGEPFDTGAMDEHDVAIAGSSLWYGAIAAGAKLRDHGRWTEPLKDEHLDRLGLLGMREESSKIPERHASFMLYASIDAVAERGLFRYIPTE